MIIATAIVAVTVFLVAVFLNYATKRYLLSRRLPGTRPAFFDFFGDLKAIENIKKSNPEFNFNAAVLQMVTKYTNAYRKTHIGCYWISYVPFVVFYTPESAEEMIAGTRSLKKGWGYRFIHPWLGTGLLTSSGEKWRSRRKLLAPTFHSDVLKDFLPILNEQAQIFSNILRKGTTEDSIDVLMPAILCSLDIICETIHGVKINVQENQNSEYVDAVIRASNIIAERTVNPKYWIDAIFPLTQHGKQLQKDLKLLHEFTRSVIKEKKEKLLKGDMTESDKKKRKALMDILLEHHIETKQLTEEDIREEVDTFTFEGHDTVSISMSFTMYLIGLHKDVQDELHKEMDRIFGDDTERPVTMEDIGEMTLLECVLKESRRLYPPVPFISREATADIEIQGHKIPKGTQCVVLIYEIFRDEKAFPDPEKFDPSRFKTGKSANRHPFSYIPFSAGARNCIGQRFAQLEEKVVLATVLRNFTLESLDSREKMILAPELILRPLNPIRIRIRPRQR